MPTEILRRGLGIGEEMQSGFREAFVPNSTRRKESLRADPGTSRTRRGPLSASAHHGLAFPPRALGSCCCGTGPLRCWCVLSVYEASEHFPQDGGSSPLRETRADLLGYRVSLRERLVEVYEGERARRGRKCCKLCDE